MKTLNILIASVVVLSSLSGFKYEDKEQISFDTVKIGDQEWTASDMNASIFKNGDPIPEVKTKEEWMKYGKEGKPAYCYYGFDESQRKQKGKLYNWFAVNDPRGLAPSGWHVASVDEWLKMIEFLGGKTPAGLQLKSTEGWNKNGNGNNKTGFSAFPGGLCTVSGYFNSINDYASWWTSSEKNAGNAWHIYMISANSEINRYCLEKEIGFYVRCVKDK